MIKPLFNLDEIRNPQSVDQTEPAADPDISKADVRRDRLITVHTAKVETLKELAGRLPTPGEIYFLWTINSFNAFTFIPYVIKECGVIDSLTLTTYSINQRIIDALMRYIDNGKIKRVHLFISDSIKFRMPKVFDMLTSLTDHRKDVISVTYAWNHSKVALMHAAGNWLVVEGSGNFSENAQHEQYVFLNSKEVYDFRYRWIHSEVNA